MQQARQIKIIMNSNPSKKPQRIFVYLALLTVFLMLLEISFFVQCNKAYLSDFNFVSNQINIPSSIMPGIFWFMLAQLLVHAGFCLLVWFAASFTAYLFRLDSDDTFNLALGLWFMGLAAALAANQHYFPNSKFSELTAVIMPYQTLAAAMTWLLSGACLLILAAGCAGFLLWMTKKSFNYTLLFMLFLAAGAWVSWGPIAPIPRPSSQPAAPNIIIIGIDSLRPDFLGYFGADHSTPFIDAMLQQSTVFTEAVTPLARTFPSWSSILLGKYPRQSGIRFNLADTSRVDLSLSLPAILKRHGYETIYTTDETRFSNIDRNFGFDEIITPPTGLNDFLLGTFNDFPLSNLIVNTSVGRKLFPYSYANRPAFVTYDPDSFINLIKSSLQPTHQVPVFLAAHFCLPHHPYLWSSLPGSQYTPQERYRESIIRVDRQIKSLFAVLRAANLLDHAVVVVLSDHGEALELSGDRITQRENFLGKLSTTGETPRFYPPSLDQESVNQSAGHGTDVLGLTQYHTLLAVKLYGMGQQRTGDVTGIVSFTDLKSALLELAGIENNHVSIAEIVRGRHKQFAAQHVFMESDFTPEAIRTVYPETRKVLLEGIQLFQINPDNTRLTVKKKMGEMIINSKQVADIYGDWMLALYPQNTTSYTPILINLKTGQWTNDLHSAFARQSPSGNMLAALKKFYGNDLHEI